METITRNAKSEAIKLLKQCNGDKKKATDIVIQNLERDEKSDLTKEKKDFLYKFWDDVTDHITEFNYDEYMQIKNIKKTHKRCKYCNRSLKRKHGNADYCNEHHRKLYHMGYTPQTAPKNNRISLSEYIEKGLSLKNTPENNNQPNEDDILKVFSIRVNTETYYMWRTMNKKEKRLLNDYIEKGIKNIRLGNIIGQQDEVETKDTPDTKPKRSKTLLIFVAVFLFTYLLFAIIQANFNFTTWNYEVRIFSSITGLCLGILMSIFNNIKSKI